jgi:hypothetical protein
MNTNSRQIQAFEVNPIFVFERCPGVDIYTFKLENKDSPNVSIWEISRKASELEFYPINEEYLRLEYPKEEHPLNELNSYSISVTATSQDSTFYSQADLFVFDENIRTSFVDFSNRIYEGQEDDHLKSMFYRFVDNITMEDLGTGPGGWFKGRPPTGCYSLIFKRSSECG